MSPQPDDSGNFTFPRFNMELEHDILEEETPFGSPDHQVPP